MQRDVLGEDSGKNKIFSMLTREWGHDHNTKSIEYYRKYLLCGNNELMCSDNHRETRTISRNRNPSAYLVRSAQLQGTSSLIEVPVSKHKFRSSWKNRQPDQIKMVQAQLRSLQPSRRKQVLYLPEELQLSIQPKELLGFDFAQIKVLCFNITRGEKLQPTSRRWDFYLAQGIEGTKL